MTRLRLLLAGAGLALLAPSLALAHERFIRHVLKTPLNDMFFRQQPGGVLGMHPDMFQIGVLVTLNLAGFLTVWFMRDALDHFGRSNLLPRRARSRARRSNGP